MTDRDALVGAIEDKLGGRRLIWVGIRGEDVEPLADLDQLYAAFGFAGTYTHRASVLSLAYEQILGERVDPETWDIDDHLRDEATTEFRHAILTTLASPSVVLPYRPTKFLSGVQFARQDRCEHLGMFGAFTSAFEHKPWVETEMRKLGVDVIPWTYIADEDQLSRAPAFDGNAGLVLRKSRTSGGEGFTRVGSPQELESRWPWVEEAFASVAPYLSGGLPLNVGATVWRDGQVTVHATSVQLIGVASCTTREFGYCGNDFGAARRLDRATVDLIEDTTERIARWLWTHGYLGTFGVDYLLHRGRLLFTEINPRFQGSSHPSSRLDVEAGLSCLMLEHVAAWLGLERPPSPDLWTRMTGARDLANVVVHWTADQPGYPEPSELLRAVRHTEVAVRADVLAPPGIRCHQGAVTARVQLRRPVTSDGYALDPNLDTIIRRWQDGAAAQQTDEGTSVGLSDSAPNGNGVLRELGGLPPNRN